MGAGRNLGPFDPASWSQAKLCRSAVVSAQQRPVRCSGNERLLRHDFGFGKGHVREAPLSRLERRQSQRAAVIRKNRLSAAHNSFARSCEIGASCSSAEVAVIAIRATPASWLMAGKSCWHVVLGNQ